MTSAIIVAAGVGKRMGANVDKLWLEVAGRPVIAHTWKQFNDAPDVDEIILVVRDSLKAEFQKLAVECGFTKPFRLVIGGAERQDSVWNGISAVSSKTEIVAIQDAARPCTTAELIADTIQAARETGAAVAAQQVVDTIKETADGKTISRTVDRSKLWSVQTPQTFRVEVIRKAIATARGKNLILTDDTAACELIGQPVRLVKSNSPNPKVTVPADLPFIESLLKKS
jgi:2-C-methyl-D-erythritol 4-phosphate cytidylyltransferase